MDIFIKSFNRPFYLERCLLSVEKFVAGTYAVTVLDDGTPEQYLSKIKDRFPEIKILTSENYSGKTLAVKENIQTGKDINGYQIPTKLWRSAAENSDDCFIMTEDDVWFTEEINVDHLQKIMLENSTGLLKLGWLGNPSEQNYSEILPLGETAESVQPRDLFLSNETMMDLFFYNRFKFFTIMYKLGLADNTTKLKYWSLNSILMGMWRKDYWLHVWKDSAGTVDEKQQLRNAATYYRKNKNNPAFIARLKKEAMKTTFQSSATNSYHCYGYEFDVNYFNHLINEAWYKGEFDSMQNFPFDFSIDYFEKFLDHKVNVDEFRGWVGAFKNQYRNLGCDVEK